MTDRNPLQTYRAKRDFSATPEPAEGGEPNVEAPSFVVQKHWASRLHYDFRLELDGSMKSWAVPKGPSYDPTDKRMAVPTEDHPIAYNRFEGSIPAGHYGAGKVIIWDKGSWHPVGDARRGLREGKLKFELRGHKLQGHWTLVRMKGRGKGGEDPWLLIKEKDAWARPAEEFSVVDEMPDSVQALADHPGARATAGEDKPRPPTDGPPDGARPAALPATLSPELAVLVDAPPADPHNWVFEVKFDGYRMLARAAGGEVKLFTRNGNDWSRRLPALVASLQAMELPDGWYDGEIIMPGADVPADFQALQNAFDSERTERIVYYLFDLPFCAGQDLREVPLVVRREVLQRICERKPQANVRFSAQFDAPPQSMLQSACRLGLEGVIGKRRDCAYVSRRSSDWIKLKCSLRQEFVIGGWTDPKGSRTGIGSLLLGVHEEDGKLRYAGNVGTGFNEASLRMLRELLQPLARQRSPFDRGTGLPRGAHWVQPQLVCEVSFGEWTREGKVRHSVFHGLREDKPAKGIGEEAVQPPPQQAPGTRRKAKGKAAAARAAAATPDLPSSLRISNPQRLVDPDSGTTKLDLVRYYALVAPLMMEHLQGRPIAMVRAPDGIEGQLFFQKHLERYNLAGFEPLDPSLQPGHPPMVEVVSAEGLLAAAQMNVIEFHTWNGTKRNITRPDRMTFDIDPGEGVRWPQIQQAAELVRALLEELGLPCFLKTSGGKGLHVVVPLQRRHDWDTVKGFSQAVVQHLAQTLPDRFVAKSGPKNRVGRIFIDYLRNGYGATTVAAWSARARPGLGISVPVHWDELGKLKSGAHWKVADIHQRLDQGNTPWADYEASRKALGQAMRKLGYQA